MTAKTRGGSPEEGRLVVATLGEADGVERDRHNHVGAQARLSGGPAQEVTQRPGQVGAIVVLEAA